jgi:hypothetical protein
MADMRKAAWALVRPASTATGGRWWNGINRPEINCYHNVIHLIIIYELGVINTHIEPSTP